MFFGKKKSEPAVAAPRRVVAAPTLAPVQRTSASSNQDSAANELVSKSDKNKASAGSRVVNVSIPVADAGSNGNYKNFAGLRFSSQALESQQELAQVDFSNVINDEVNLGPHYWSRIAIARLNATTKQVILFVDKSKVTSDDIFAVIELLQKKGWTSPEVGPQGYYLISTLVISLSQKTLLAQNLAVDRDIAQNESKNSLMQSFTDIIAWAYVQNADDIDFVVDVTSSKSQVAFKIGGRYVRPSRHLLPTDTLHQMLGIAWQKSTGGGAAQFEIKTEQQAQVALDLPKSPDIPNGARVRLRWSGMANDKGTVVTMRLQRLGESAKIRGLDQAGYLPKQLEILHRVIHSEGGMAVFSGVVGSGKSTSLVQVVSLLPPDIKIVSIEDPVELEIRNAYQKTVSRDLTASGTDPGFLSATRALYRSAMDVLYLGEIRDPETGLIARQVAESGHSVYTTTHARSALGIFDRFASPAIGIPRDVLATPDIVKLLVYQALLPTTCPHCGKSPSDYAHLMELKGAELDEHHRYFDRLFRLYDIEDECFRLRNPEGCERCRNPELPELFGLSGRTVVSEIIEPDETMLGYVQEGNNIALNNYWRSLASKSFKDPNLTGKTTMECAVYKASTGQIDPREIEPRFMSFETVEMKRKTAEGRAGVRAVPMRAVQ